MSKVLEQAIEAMKALPPERQERLGEYLLDLLQEEDDVEYELTPEQLKDLEIGIAQADRREFASEEEVAAMWRKFRR